MVGREAVAARIVADIADADGVRLARDHTQKAVAVGRRTDSLAVRAADAAGDEPLDTEVLIHDSEGRILGVGELADAVRDQLQNAIQIKDAGDAASCRVHGGQFVRGLTGPSSRPGSPDDDLETPRALVHGVDGGRWGVQIERGQSLVAEMEAVGAQAGRFGRLVGQAAGSQFEFDERRSVEMEVAAAEPGTRDNALEGGGEFGLRARVGPAKGRSRVNMAPWPSPSLWTLNEPPNCCAASAALCNPKPCPLLRVVKPWVKIRGRFSGGIPTPVSATSMIAPSGLPALIRIVTRFSGRLVASQAYLELWMRFTRIWRTLCLSTDIACRCA